MLFTLFSKSVWYSFLRINPVTLSLSLNLTAKLNKSQSHYVNKVMRVKVSEVFSLFNIKLTFISSGVLAATRPWLLPTLKVATISPFPMSED